MGDTTGSDAEEQDEGKDEGAEGQEGADDTSNDGEGSDNHTDDDKSDDEGADGDDTEGGDDKGDESKDEKPEGGKSKKSGESEEDDGAAPPIRPRNARERIIARQNRTATKKDDTSKDDAEEDGGEGEDESLDPDDDKRIEKVVDKKLAPVLEAEQERVDKAESDEFFNDPKNKWAVPDKAKIMRWWKDPSRHHLPLSAVAYEVAGRRLMKVGAQQEREATGEANRTRSKGHSGRSAGQQKPASEMTRKEVDERIAATQRRRLEQS